jgi:hypothetical protein
LAEPIVKIHQKEIQANQFLQQISVNQKTSWNAPSANANLFDSNVNQEI